MKKITSAILISLISTGMAYAATPCEQFEVKISNNTSDNLLVTTIKLDGADLQPGGIQKIDSKQTQVFTVNGSSDKAMSGEFVFHSLDLPSKLVKINFELQNYGVVCQHTDKTPASDYAVEKTRVPGKVEYNINN